MDFQNRFQVLACSSRTEMSLELLLISESSLEENCRLADDVTAVENKKSERCGIDGGGVSLLKNWKALGTVC